GLDGCNAYLCRTKPELIKRMHASCYEAGGDPAITTSFVSSSVVLAEDGIAEPAYDLSERAAEAAGEVADDFASRSSPRFVSGAVGPTTKLPTLGHITFDALYQAYIPQLKGLIDGGCDLLQIETCQDILQLKCAVIAARDAMKECGKEIPFCVTLTVET